MQIGKECEPYLKSQEVITILQSGNETFKSRVFNCITKYKKLICSNILLTHKLIEAEILKMCCENAFQDAQVIFAQKVKDNLFSPDYETCIPFLKGIFRKIYWYEYQKELKRKMAIKHTDKTMEDYRMQESKKSIQETLKPIVLTLSAQDQLIYKLYYEHGMKLREIAEQLNLQYQTVRDRSSKICRTIVNNWKF